MKNQRIMFMGTPLFSAYSLNALVENGYNVACVVTRTDMKKDRGQQVKFSPVKETAIEYDIPVYQPENLKPENFSEILSRENPDIIVVVAYGKILPPYVLSYPKYGCINAHASLLPKYRGSAPIQYAVAKGEKVSGITTMLMNEGLDTGDILLKKEVEIAPDDTGGLLHDKLMPISAALLMETIDNIQAIKPEKQDDSLSTYAPPIKKEDALIDFNAEAEEIINKIRGFYPIPTTTAKIGDVFYKIHKAELVVRSEELGVRKPSEVAAFDKNRLLIAAKNGFINILEIQPPNKKKMSVTDFYNGNRIN